MVEKNRFLRTFIFGISMILNEHNKVISKEQLYLEKSCWQTFEDSRCDITFPKTARKISVQNYPKSFFGTR